MESAALAAHLACALRSSSPLHATTSSALCSPPPPARPPPRCSWGAPVFLSKPRFLDCSDELAAGVVGLGDPDRSKHDTSLGVEPTSGQTLDFHWRLAANMHVAPVPGYLGFTFFDSVTPVYVPVMWADRYGTANADQVSLFKGRVYFALDLIMGAKWGGLAVALVSGLALLAFVGTAWQRSRAKTVSTEAQLAHYEALLGAYDATAEAEGGSGGEEGAGGGAPLRTGSSRRVPSDVSGPGRPAV